ncbi:putative glycosyltransferase EpsF [bacterium BMS3Bbin04]|nr:putative glycosyltransferase EpsF [bacterium BMS3Bbin04]
MILNLMREIDRERFQFDFLVQKHERASYDDEAESMGATIHRITGYKNLPVYGAQVYRLMRNYDSVHSHVYAYSGFLMYIARLAGVPQRIVHSHTHREADEHPSFLRGLYLTWMKHLIRREATEWFACSVDAGRSLFGEMWDHWDHCRVIPNAINLDAFHSTVQPEELRSSFGIPLESPVIGHVGRFVPEKNHSFLLDIFGELLIRKADSHLVLVGDGPERQSIEDLVKQRGWVSRVHFLGLRSDVPDLMRGLFDILLLPSKWEGVPLTVIEAQAAGLPCLASSVVPDEALVVPSLVKRLDFIGGIEAWAQVINDHMKIEGISHEGSYDLVAKSGYNASITAKTLETVYSRAGSR